MAKSSFHQMMFIRDAFNLLSKGGKLNSEELRRKYRLITDRDQLIAMSDQLSRFYVENAFFAGSIELSPKEEESRATDEFPNLVSMSDLVLSEPSAKKSKGYDRMSIERSIRNKDNHFIVLVDGLRRPVFATNLVIFDRIGYITELVTERPLRQKNLMTFAIIQALDSMKDDLKNIKAYFFLPIFDYLVRVYYEHFGARRVLDEKDPIKLSENSVLMCRRLNDSDNVPYIGVYLNKFFEKLPFVVPTIYKEAPGFKLRGLDFGDARTFQDYLEQQGMEVIPYAKKFLIPGLSENKVLIIADRKDDSIGFATAEYKNGHVFCEVQAFNREDQAAVNALSYECMKVFINRFSNIPQENFHFITKAENKDPRLCVSQEVEAFSTSQQSPQTTAPRMAFQYSGAQPRVNEEHFANNNNNNNSSDREPSASASTSFGL